MRRAVALALLGALGCAPEVPDATYVCTATADCPPQQTCVAGLCRRDPGDAGTRGVDAGPCVPEDCESLRAFCGDIDDGCGGTLDCGACEAPDVCGGGGIPNFCDCEPARCDDSQCGQVDNGCGALMDCGGCPAGETCDEGVCGCTTQGCDGRCGTVSDGCGGELVCGGCVDPEVCGAGGPDRCGVGTCVPATCESLGAECGTASDGCGNPISCGTCAAPETCGGAGVANVCGCTPQTCAELGASCGSVDDGCSGTVACGGCTAPTVCGAVTPNQCGCPPFTCDPAQCGLVDPGCGPQVNCGTCGDGATCNRNVCECLADSGEPNERYDSAVFHGELGVGSVSVAEYNLHVGGDRDWHRWDVAPWTGGPYTHTITVTLGGLPEGLDAALTVHAQCTFSGLEDEVTCSSGATRTHPMLGVGCRSQTPGNAEEIVVLHATCSPSSFYVHVEPIESGPCKSYELTLSYSRVDAGSI